MKSRKKYLRIVSLVLAIVFVASVCVFADPDSREQPNRATVTTTFHAMGGSVSPSYTLNVVGSTYGTVPVPTKSGYVFMGWFPEPYVEGIEITGNSIVPSENVTVYAHWAMPARLFNLASGKCLNIDGSNLTYLYNGMNVTVWQDSGSNEQKWLKDECVERFYMRSYVDRNYGLVLTAGGSSNGSNVYWAPYDLGNSYQYWY